MPPFSSGRGARLLEDLTGVPIADLQQRWEFRNLLTYWPGRAPTGGDLFPLREARTAAFLRMSDWRQDDRIVFCGRRVAEAFDFDAPWFRWERFGMVNAAVMPHPSGLSRVWNDPAQRAGARWFLQRLWEAS